MKTRRIAYVGLLLSLALILSWVENMIPLPVIGIPGMKLGLANLAILITLYLFGPVDALAVDLLKVLVTGFLFGNGSMMLYSMAGAVVSYLVMFLLFRLHFFSPCGISIGGGVFHNVGQMIVACFVVQSYSVLTYAPYLLLCGLITGAILGVFAGLLIPRLRNYLHTLGE